MAKPKQRERDAAMVAAFIAGESGPSIGKRFGVSGVWVSQVVRDAGLTRRDGGRAVIAAKNQARRKAERAAARNERSARVRLGCDFATAMALNNGECFRKTDSLAMRYYSQHSQARKRGIGWEFTFPTWVALWAASGKLSERGRSKEAYVMARLGDTGPYSPANVYITTLSQNFIDYHATALAEGTYWFQVRKNKV